MFISFWSYLHRWQWFEGPKATSPLALMNSIPSGQSQRYQIQNYSSYFERWAEHVSSAYKASLKSKQIILINYNDLLQNHCDCLKGACQDLGINLISEPKLPPRENYIKAENKGVSLPEKEEIISFTLNQIKNYPYLPAKILEY